MKSEAKGNIINQHSSYYTVCHIKLYVVTFFIAMPQMQPSRPAAFFWKGGGGGGGGEAGEGALFFLFQDQ